MTRNSVESPEWRAEILKFAGSVLLYTVDAGNWKMVEWLLNNGAGVETQVIFSAFSDALSHEFQ